MLAICRFSSFNGRVAPHHSLRAETRGIFLCVIVLRHRPLPVMWNWGCFPGAFCGATARLMSEPATRKGLRNGGRFRQPKEFLFGADCYGAAEIG